MSPQSRGERIRQAYEAFNTGDMDAVMELLDERVVRFEVHLEREEALAALRGDTGP